MPLTTVSQGLLSTDAQYTGFKNRIINGDMVIDQRNNGAAVTVNALALFYGIDRFRAVGQNSSGVFTVQRIADAPTGFINSARVTVTTADASISAGDRYFFQQVIEGFNAADLGFGTANAQTVTLSFWVKSSLTGSFGGCLQNDGPDRSYPFSYTISAANTWEYKTVTIPGDTSGTWATNNTGWGRVTWSMGNGSTTTSTANSWQSANYEGVNGQVQPISTLNATWQITGVQLEKGNVATSFDVLSYGTELALCQRYCIKIGGDTGNNTYMAFGLGGNTTTALLFYYPQTAFRTTPSLASYTSLVIDDTNGAISISNLVLDPSGSSPNFVRLNATATGLAQFRPYFLRSSASTGNLVLSAEL
jgi:hypothetical protein